MWHRFFIFTNYILHIAPTNNRHGFLLHNDLNASSSAFYEISSYGEAVLNSLYLNAKEGALVPHSESRNLRCDNPSSWYLEQLVPVVVSVLFKCM